MTGPERASASRIRLSKILAVVGMICVAYLGLTTLILHLQPTGYDPVRQVVSDYAVGQFGVEMALGFFIGGIGVVSLALAILLTRGKPVFKIGSSLLFIAGVALFVIGAFPTDLEGTPTTVHGTIHSILSVLVFTTGPVGMVVLSYGYGRRWLLTTVVGFALTSVFAVTVQLGLQATGLAERGLILLLLSWWFTASLKEFQKIRQEDSKAG